MKAGRRVVLMFGFEKKDQANIKADELRAFRKAARVYLSYSEEEMTAIAQDKALTEIFNPSTAKGDRHGKGI